MTDFLEQKRKEIVERLDELRPLVKEYKRLEAAAAALRGIPASRNGASASGGSTARRRGPGRPRGSKTRKTVASPASTPAAKPKGRKRRAGRRKGSGTRAAATLELVQAQPGITISELAAKMGIKQNYLYRVLPGLEEEGKITKTGRGFHPTQKAKAAA